MRAGRGERDPGRRPCARLSALIVCLLAAGCARADRAPTAPPAAAAAGREIAPASPDPAPAGRLGDRVVPRAARLELDLDPDRVEFTGRIELELDLRAPVSAIWLHARALEIRGAVLLRAGGAPLGLAVLEPPASDPDLLGLAIGGRLGPGRAVLRIDYRGRLGDMVGLFRQWFEGRWYAYSDLEPIDARAAFPCFDDPRFKIPWRVVLRVPRGLEALSNAPAVARRAEGDRQIVEFAPTRPLPSYLVAVAVGPFEVATATRSRGGPPIRVIAPRGHVGRGSHALVAAAGLLTRAEEFMGGPAGWPKLDFIAVPRFGGAMENPGLITVSQDILLLDEGLEGEARRDRIALLLGVLAHEIAHLWFGDLVTMEHWTELWLNEGLATWMSDWMVRAFDREAGALVEIADKARAARLDREVGGAARSVRQPIRADREAGGQFGPLTYRKGGAIIATVEALIGRGALRRALRRYVAAHADGTATTADLAAALSTEAGRDLAPVLASLLDQPGIPLVEAALVCEAGMPPRVRLRQEGYAPLGAPAEAAARRRERRWQLPVCVRAAGVAVPACTVMTGERAELPLPLPLDTCPAWIHPNPDERGYYQYTLPPAGMTALAAAPLTARELAGLADNTGAILRSGHLPLGAGLDTLAALARRGDQVAVARTLPTWRLIARSLVPPDRRAALGRRLAPLAPLARRIGTTSAPGDGTVTRALRAELVPLVAREAGERSLQRAALARLEAWLDDRLDAAPPRAEMEVLYQVAAPAGGARLFERLLAAGRGRATVALVGFRDPALVRRALAGVAAGERAAPDALLLLAGFLADPVAHPVALPVALDTFAELAARLPDQARPRAARLFEAVCRPEDRARVAAVLDAVYRAGGELHPAAAAVLAGIDECVAFRDHHAAAAARLLR